MTNKYDEYKEQGFCNNETYLCSQWIKDNPYADLYIAYCVNDANNINYDYERWGGYPITDELKKKCREAMIKTVQEDLTEAFRNGFATNNPDCATVNLEMLKNIIFENAMRNVDMRQLSKHFITKYSA